MRSLSDSSLKVFNLLLKRSSIMLRSPFPNVLTDSLRTCRSLMSLTLRDAMKCSNTVIHPWNMILKWCESKLASGPLHISKIKSGGAPSSVVPLIISQYSTGFHQEPDVDHLCINVMFYLLHFSLTTIFRCLQETHRFGITSISIRLRRTVECSPLKLCF